MSILFVNACKCELSVDHCWSSNLALVGFAHFLFSMPNDSESEHENKHDGLIELALLENIFKQKILPRKAKTISRENRSKNKTHRTITLNNPHPACPWQKGDLAPKQNNLNTSATYLLDYQPTYLPPYLPPSTFIYLYHSLSLSISIYKLSTWLEACRKWGTKFVTAPCTPWLAPWRPDAEKEELR